MFVAVPPSTSKPPARPVEKLKIGPPRGQRKEHDPLSRTTTVTSAPVMHTSMSPSVSVDTVAATPVRNTKVMNVSRNVVDKGVATENPPLERLSPRQSEFLKALGELIL